MKVTITGSLGSISKPLTMGLLKKGHEVTIVSSKMDKKKDIEALGAIAAIGSVENADFLASAFAGADAVYCMVPPNFTELDQESYYKRIGTSYAQAIRRSGVKRAVHLSSWGAHLDHGTGIIVGSHHAETILNGFSDVSLTHLRPGSFYTNLYQFIPMIKGMGFIGINYGGDDMVALAHPTDIAAAAVEELVTTTAGKNVRYVVSDDRTANEIVRCLGAAIGKPDLKWNTFRDKQTQSGLENSGIPSPLAAKFVELNASIHSGLIREDYDLHKPKVMGRVKLEDFAKEFAAAFLNA
jgi:uncharacterized protein YbjT (DUF2867 family)